MIKFMKIAGIILALLSIFKITNLGLNEYKKSYFQDSKNPIEQLKKFNNNQSKPTILIFHKEGCSDCKSVVKFVNKELLLNIDKVNYVVVSTNSKSGKALIHQYSVYKVPTFILFNHNHEISRYEDTEKNQISEIMNGKILN
ncbi:thioredoxin family protein [Weissella kandleri]|uniref:thioredoxin family protein n=1 Tax=Weissella kandleri TaxID=1616 RepID=UPI00070B3FC6|nr:thioredoxin family protein [Weissella kandleri]